MRFATYDDDGRPAFGVVAGEAVVRLSDGDLAEALAAWGPDELCARAERAIERAAAGGPGAAARPLASLRLLPPVLRPPKNVVCVARNYLEHAREAARFGVGPTEPPEVPMFFSKPRTTLVGPQADVLFDPRVTAEVDYEGELAVVIGRAGAYIPKDRAFSHVFGYTVANDVTARDLQRRYRQYYKGKGLDTFCPLGPVVVTADEVGDPAALRIRTRVNGELRQDESVAALIFDIPTIIAHWSAGMTIEPGDLLLTGTPFGVGAGQDPPAFLHDGDVVEVTIEGIGTLRNPFRARRA
ncbi:MAG: fumarylacetoacetate hydrolase family protein [Clostridia bacterium]|nr:fumarylacetoacetate hydrolase family protein [Clostridia bacterium]